MASFFDLEKKKKKPGEASTTTTTPSTTTPATTVPKKTGKSFFDLETKNKGVVESLQTQRNVKPGESTTSQIKPVDQVEEEQKNVKPWEERSFLEKAHAVASENWVPIIGDHLKKTGAALGDTTPAVDKPWEQQTTGEKIKSTVMEAPATIVRPILNSGIKASQGAVGVGGFLGLDSAEDASAAIQKYRTDYDKGIKAQTYDEGANIFQNPELLLNPEYITRTVVEQLPNLALMTRTAGLGEGVLELGGAFNERMVRAAEQGEKADTTDRLYAGTIGIINGALGKIGFNALFDKNPGLRKAISEKIGNSVANAVAAVGSTGVEMGTEYIQEVIPEIATKIIYDEGGTWQEVLAQANKQGLTAASAAGVISAPVAAVNYGVGGTPPAAPEQRGFDAFVGRGGNLDQKINGTDEMGTGKYFSRDESVAKQFGDVEKVRLDLDESEILKVETQEDYDALMKQALKEYPDMEPTEAITEVAKAQGYRAIEGSPEFDPIAGINVIDETAITTPLEAPAGVEPNPTINASPVAIEEERGYKAPDRITELVEAIESGDQARVDAVSSQMSAKELGQARLVAQELQNKEPEDDDQLQTFNTFTETVGSLSEGKSQAIEDAAVAILDGGTVEGNLSVSDRDKVAQIVNKAKEAVPEEERAAIDERLAALQSDDFDGIESAREMDNESNPFFTAKDEDEVSFAFEQNTKDINGAINELNDQKSEYLAERNETTDPVKIKELKSLMESIDEERRGLQADLKLFESQANAKNLVLLQSTIDKIRKVDPSFSLARSIDERWNASDYKRHLASFGDVPRGTQSSETEEEKIKPAKAVRTVKNDNGEKYKTTLNIQDKDDVEQLKRIFGDGDALENIKNGVKTNWRGDSYEDLGRVNIISETPKTSYQKIAEGKIHPYTLEDNTLYHGTSPETAEAIKSEGFKVGSSLPDGAFRGGGYDAKQNSISFSTDPKIAANFTGQGSEGVLIEVSIKPEAKIVTIDGIDYAEDLNNIIKDLRNQGIDAIYLEAEKEVVVINKKVIGEISVVRNFNVYNRKKDLEDIFGDTKIDFTPFSVRKSKPNNRRVSKDEQAAREIMQDDLGATLFDENLWDRVIAKTEEGSTNIEDFALLQEIKEAMEAGTRIDFALVREAYQVLARYGIPVNQVEAVENDFMKLAQESSSFQDFQAKVKEEAFIENAEQFKEATGEEIEAYFIAAKKAMRKEMEFKESAFVAYDRGLQGMKIQLLSRVKEGTLTEREYQEMSYALDLFSKRVREMALRTGAPDYSDSTAGMYDFISSAVSLFEKTMKQETLPQVFFHEIGHHISRYIPREMLMPLYQQFSKERYEFFESNQEFAKADDLSDDAKHDFYASHNPEENYKYFSFDEWVAETVKEKTTEEIQNALGVENESFVMAVIRYMKQLLADMKAVITRFRGEDVADEMFKLLKSDAELPVVSQVGLDKSIEFGYDYMKQLERRRKELYEQYQEQVDKMAPETALAFERAFNKSIDESSLYEAADILIRADMKASKSGAFSVSKLPEAKYDGAFVAPGYVDEYKSIIDQQAMIIAQEKEIMDQERIYAELGGGVEDILQEQMDSFTKLLKTVRDKKGKEILSSGDSRQVTDYLIAQKNWTGQQVDDMLYDFSQEKNNDDVLDTLRAAVMNTDPGLLVGRKLSKQLGMDIKVKSAKERVEAGDSEFSDQYAALEKEKEAILKESQAQYTQEDLSFIKASEELKELTYEMRRDREKKDLLRKGATLGKAIKKGQFQQRIKEFTDRKRKVRYAKEFFGLSDTQFKKIGGNRPVQYLSDAQFNVFLDRLQEAAAVQAERSFFIDSIYETIRRKNIKKAENLQKAWNFPTIPNMSIDQLKQFGNALDSVAEGDTFLTRRQIQTVDNTELKGIKTLGEAKVRLAERMGVDPSKLQNVSSTEFDRFRYDTALAESNPFYELLVDDTNREFLIAEEKVYDIRDNVNRLIKAARKSRPKRLIDRFIPSDKRIFDYLESAEKGELAKDMTDAELEAAEYIRQYYEEARNYLMERKMMERFRENYITHVRKRFLETWKDESAKKKVKVVDGKEVQGKKQGTMVGLIKALKGVFEQYKEDESTFNILDGDTGNILPMEKFFQFSMRRSGKIDPTTNVASAFLAYVSTFEKKRAFDAIIPKMEIYADSIAGERKTPEGLLFDRSLKSFLREWINNKKGRRNNLGGMVKQGGKIDLSLRFGNALVTLLDLGFSIPAGVASQVGEQTTNFIQMGTKNWIKGQWRLKLPKGRAMAKKYAAFNKENPWTHLAEASDNVGDTVSKAMFVLFRDASWRANRHYFLGSLTKEEWASGEVSPERLAQMKRDMGRWRVVEGAESVIGSTSAGKVGSKYKGWAVPILRTLSTDLMTIYKNPKMLKSREGQELFRVTVVTALATLALYGIIGDEDKKQSEMSFWEKLEYKALRDAFSLTASLDPTLWASTPRLLAFTYGLANGMRQLVMLEKYKTSGEWGKAGTLKGDNTIRRELTPMIIKQFTGGEK